VASPRRRRSTITRYGAALSPYYHKVKIALIEKDVNFREQFTPPSQDAAMLPGIGESTRLLFGTSLIDESPELTALYRTLTERPSVARCWADRAAAFERFWAWRKQQAAG